MEPSFKTITIDKEIKFKKAALEPLKDSKKCDHNVFTIFNVTFCISLYPNGDEDEWHGQTWLFVYAEPRNATIVEANIDCNFGFGGFSTNNCKGYVDTNGWGEQICTTEELFDPKKNFFIIDEMIIKIKGTMKIRLSPNRIAYPFSAQWKIKEADLEGLKNSTNNSKNGLWSKEFKVASDSDIKYYLKFCPNGNKEVNRGKSLTGLFLRFGNTAKKVEAFYNITIDSANYTGDIQKIFEISCGHCIEICSTEDLFNPENGYFIDGEMIIKIIGTVTMQKEENNSAEMECDENTVKKDHTSNGDKDFTIKVGKEKSIKVHKQLLIDSSPYFIGLFNSGMIESIEMKTTITDFDYEIVEAGIQILYDPSKIPSNFSFEQMLELLRFSDKYDIQIIKDLIQNHFVENLSPTNVCPLINYTTTTVSASNLHAKCIEYVIQRSKESNAIHGLETLDKELWFKILTGTFVQNL